MLYVRSVGDDLFTPDLSKLPEESKHLSRHWKRKLIVLGFTDTKVSNRRLGPPRCRLALLFRTSHLLRYDWLSLEGSGHGAQLAFASGEARSAPHDWRNR